MPEQADLLATAPQYSLAGDVKRAALLAQLTELTRWHEARCLAYANVLRALAAPSPPQRLEDVPYLPVRLFKTRRLQSVPDEQVFKVLLSSGTTGQTPSRIVLDQETAQRQTRALAAIMTSFLGQRRMPMLICDTADVLKDRASFSARGAGILGMAPFGRDHCYALDGAMALQVDALREWLARHTGQPLLVFGFTFMVWQYIIERLRELKIRIEPHGGVLVHGGGWKALQQRAVDNVAFRRTACETLGVARVHDYYGMVEQTGSIYVECEHGWLHASNFAEVLVRDYHDWSPCPVGVEGVLQSLSVLPRSYPGHSLLTEDLAVLHGVDDCPCGRLGSRFTLSGRIPRAELRGCSDTHAQTVAGG